MSSLEVAGVMFGGILGSTLAGMAIAGRLPGHHLTGESRDVIKLGLGVIATLTSLVLGLLVASTKGTYDTQSGTVKELAAQLVLLDKVLGRYGPETQDVRVQLRFLTQAVITQLWPQDVADPNEFPGGDLKSAGEAAFESIAALDPKTDTQRMLKARAQEIMMGLGQLRLRLLVNSERSIPVPFLVVLALWQSFLFAGFGLLVPRNGTTLAVLTICMVCISGAVFLVLELDRPFEGWVRVSEAPLRMVLSRMGE